MSRDSTTVVEEYMDSFFGSTLASKATSTPTAISTTPTPESKESFLQEKVVLPKPDKAQLKSKPLEDPCLTEPAPLKQAIADLEDVCKLEESRREQLQALLTRQAWSQPSVSSSYTEQEKEGIKPVTVVTPQEIESVEPGLTPSVNVRLTDTAQPESSVLTPDINTEWCSNGRPMWAQNAFDVLLFKVSGLTLAVPLIALGQIHPISDKLTPIFGQVDWFMGLLETPTGRVRTVNTALYVMPERYNPEFVKTAKYVVSIDGSDWGLAVDEVQQPTLLDLDGVTWRTQRSKRPWLAGTVKSAMCALLDIPTMGQTLQNHGN